MKYTAHPLGKQDNLPLIAIFDEDGECVATLTMDDIALLYTLKEEEGPPKSLQEMQEQIEPLTKPMKMGFPEIDEQWKTHPGTILPERRMLNEMSEG